MIEVPVYLLHFDRPISDRHTCQHYLGYCAGSISDRLERHAQGQGARLTAIAVQRRVGWVLARTWPEGDRKLERKLKKRKSGNKLCPICNPTNLKKKGT